MHRRSSPYDGCVPVRSGLLRSGAGGGGTGLLAIGRSVDRDGDRLSGVLRRNAAELRGRSEGRAVYGLLDVGQPKLAVGPAGDPCEVEAGRIAGEVMALLRRGAPGGSADVGYDGQEQVDGAKIGRRAVVDAQGGDVDRDTESAIQSARSGGAPLDRGTQVRIEGAFGADFSRVRVHTGSASTDLNERVQAKAFTIGNDIFFRDAPPDAQTSPGQELLAHELTHVVQQAGAGPSAGLPARIGPVRTGLESVGTVRRQIAQGRYRLNEQGRLRDDTEQYAVLASLLSGARNRHLAPLHRRSATSNTRRSCRASRRTNRLVGAVRQVSGRGATLR